MADGDPLDWIVFLARSKTRVQILKLLETSGEISRSEAANEIDASERTIMRAFNNFAERGWVDKAGRSYQLTPVGELVVGEFLELVDSFEEIDELSTFLRWFPPSEATFDTERLRDGTVVTYSESEPYAPARAQSQLLERTARYRAILPSVDIEGTEIANERMAAGALEAELVVPPRIKETMGNDEFGPLMREFIDNGQLTLLVSESIPEFHLGIADEEIVQIGVEDDDGLPRALVETNDEAIREWAEACYQQYRSQARTVPATEL